MFNFSPDLSCWTLESMQGRVTISTDQPLAAGVGQTQGNDVLVILIQNLGQKKAFPGCPCYLFDVLWFSPANPSSQRVPCLPEEAEAPY